jgi:hypothetical protein
MNWCFLTSSLVQAGVEALEPKMFAITMADLELIRRDRAPSDLDIPRFASLVITIIFSSTVPLDRTILHINKCSNNKIENNRKLTES